MSHLRYSNGPPPQAMHFENARFWFEGQAWMTYGNGGQQFAPAAHPASSHGFSGSSCSPRSSHASLHSFPKDYSKSNSSRNSTTSYTSVQKDTFHQGRSNSEQVHSYACLMKNETLQRSRSSIGSGYMCSCSSDSEVFQANRSSTGSAHSYAVKSEPSSPWSAASGNSFSSLKNEEPFQQQQRGTSSCSSGSGGLNKHGEWYGRLRPRPLAAPRNWTYGHGFASQPATAAYVPFDFVNFNTVVPGRPRI